MPGLQASAGVLRAAGGELLEEQGKAEVEVKVEAGIPHSLETQDARSCPGAGILFSRDWRLALRSQREVVGARHAFALLTLYHPQSPIGGGHRLCILDDYLVTSRGW